MIATKFLVLLISIVLWVHSISALPLNQDVDTHPHEKGNYFEGDIMTPQGSERSGLQQQNFRWTDGIIPYEIAGDYNAQQLAILNAAFDHINQKTCLQFRPKTEADKDYLSIRNDPKGCFSYVGRQGGKQVLNLEAPSCLWGAGTPMHELMHAIGIVHEHSRPDRDEYIQIMWDNIIESSKAKFNKRNPNDVGDFGVGYDYGSIMHLSATAYSKNGKPTIVPLKDPNAVIGQTKELSNSDILKINNMYAGMSAKKV